MVDRFTFYRPTIEVKLVAFEVTERAEFRQFDVVQNDTYPPVQIQVLDGINDPMDLTGWTVHFFFRKVDSSVLLNAGHTECAITSETNGMAQYNWQVGDLSYAGMHFGEFQLTHPTLGRQTLPIQLRINVGAEIDSVSGFF